ncbi:hypothetical protein [Deinococcus sp. S9]|uniref:hypothetical protein n=1 Tax=Deinococcus sp. S9 TaxID=2545754 RepID=UPI001054CC54|nr:hypothetical protein [Deinococcus sp. S9]TDE85575.1 hypothetical protein E0686_11225 [Deinococcus sp. S9]
MSEETQAVRGVTEEAAFDAVFYGKPMTIKFSIGTGEQERELEVAVMWPDGDDETEIISRATAILNIQPDFATTFDLAWARGRAALEQLAAPPFPEWLSGPDGAYLSKQPVMWHGKRMVRPDTGKMKNKAIPAAFWYAYQDVISRFHTVAAG